MLRTVADIFFPPVCPLCESGLYRAPQPLCPECMGGFEAGRITGPVCTVCGDIFPSGAGAGHVCGECIKRPPPFTRARSAFVFNGSVLAAIHRFKYGGKVILAHSLGALLQDAALDACPTADVVMPVPLHRARLRHRGYNQSLMLARPVAKRLGCVLDYMSLRRVRDTEAQTKLKSAERHDNVSGAFELRGPHALKGKKVLLVDDVFTTGATASQCAAVIKKAGAEVFIATLARAAGQDSTTC